MSLPIRMHRTGRGRRSSVARTVAWIAGATAGVMLRSGAGKHSGHGRRLRVCEADPARSRSRTDERLIT